ncbi:leucine-rich-repeat protein [Candidatus Moduliflexus flocculans]|uniref:Leucine-rich-repeat protein n=1 Tax=Candidatus Moduliflexus flocculans TaxID=1499966 RepID=A0A0S6VSC3_9BACT|nr:leucine-rich-repeat protein [Candidatus Moduliflexus flocculans]
MTAAEQASLEQIRAELEKEGKSFRELPKFAEYIEAKQRYQGEELGQRLKAIDCNFWESEPGYASNADGQVIGVILHRTKLSDLTALAAITQLQLLDVSSTPISDLTPLAALTQLREIRAYNTQVSNLTPLVALTQLKELNVGNTQVSDLTPLVALTQLLELYIYNTQISDLTPLARLTQFQELYINHTQVSDLMPLVRLTQLEILVAKNCRVSLLPRALAERLEAISLAGNPLERPPMEIAKQGKAARLAWFYANEGGWPLNEVKALLVGDGGAGKTSLVKRLFGEMFDPHESQTHGILIRDWKMDERDITVHLWDFGGQEIMHTTHQFFLSKRSLYILVLDGRKEEKTEYWLKHIATFGGASPVVIVTCHALGRRLVRRQNAVRGLEIAVHRLRTIRADVRSGADCRRTEPDRPCRFSA